MSDTKKSNLISTSSEITIYISPETVAAVDEYLHSDTSQEIGGLLLGTVTTKATETILDITKYIPAPFSNSFITEFRFNHEIWKELYNIKSSEHPVLEIIGWFHSHPGMKLLPSEEDMNIHKTFFQQASQVVYMVDPTTEKRCFYHWEGDFLVPVPDFYIGNQIYADKNLPVNTPETFNDDDDLETHVSYMASFHELNEQLRQVKEAQVSALQQLSSSSTKEEKSITPIISGLTPAMKGIIGIATSITLLFLAIYPALRPIDGTVTTDNHWAQTEKVSGSKQSVSPKTQQPSTLQGDNQQPAIVKIDSPPAEPQAEPDSHQQTSTLPAKQPEAATKPTEESTKSVNTTTTNDKDTSPLIQNTGDAMLAVYTVKRGDSLWNISTKYYGSGFDFYKIIKQNKLINPNALHVGMKLEIPPK